MIQTEEEYCNCIKIINVIFDDFHKIEKFYKLNKLFSSSYSYEYSMLFIFI